MSVWSLVVGAGLLFAVCRLFVRAQRRRYARLGGADDQEALRGACTAVPTISRTDHLSPAASLALAKSTSPYRVSAEELDGEAKAMHERARAALNNARWLLMSAVIEAEGAAMLAGRGRTVAADSRRLAQTQAECEALQCVFEAESLLGAWIVRDPGEPRELARFYGKPQALLQQVVAFQEQAFPSKSTRPMARCA